MTATDTTVATVATVIPEPTVADMRIALTAMHIDPTMLPDSAVRAIYTTVTEAAATAVAALPVPSVMCAVAFRAYRRTDRDDTAERTTAWTELVDAWFATWDATHAAPVAPVPPVAPEKTTKAAVAAHDAAVADYDVALAAYNDASVAFEYARSLSADVFRAVADAKVPRSSGGSRGSRKLSVSDLHQGRFAKLADEYAETPAPGVIRITADAMARAHAADVVPASWTNNRGVWADNNAPGFNARRYNGTRYAVSLTSADGDGSRFHVTMTPTGA